MTSRTSNFKCSCSSNRPCWMLRLSATSSSGPSTTQLRPSIRILRPSSARSRIKDLALPASDQNNTTAADPTSSSITGRRPIATPHNRSSTARATAAVPLIQTRQPPPAPPPNSSGSNSTEHFTTLALQKNNQRTILLSLGAKKIKINRNRAIWKALFPLPPYISF